MLTPANYTAGTGGTPTSEAPNKVYTYVTGGRGALLTADRLKTLFPLREGGRAVRVDYFWRSREPWRDSGFRRPTQSRPPRRCVVVFFLCGH